jgi:hypothetical protein
MTTTDEDTKPSDGDKLAAYLGTDTVLWAEALVKRFNIQIDDIGEVYAWTASMIMAGRDANQDSYLVIQQLCEALRLTREYVGEDVLPALPGWAWYDALVAAGKTP